MEERAELSGGEVEEELDGLEPADHVGEEEPDADGEELGGE